MYVCMYVYMYVCMLHIYVYILDLKTWYWYLYYQVDHIETVVTDLISDVEELEIMANNFVTNTGTLVQIHKYRHTLTHVPLMMLS